VFMVRTHPPEEIAEQTRAFDRLVRQSICSVADIPEEEFSDEHRTVAHLPLTKGGLGCADMSRIAPLAYAASIDPSSNDQHVRTELLNAEIIGELQKSEKWKKHLKMYGAPGSHLWLDLEGNDLHPNAVPMALQLRLGWAPRVKNAKTHIFCEGCKRLVRLTDGTLRAFDLHTLGCCSQKGAGPIHRHTAVNTTISRFCHEFGINHSAELWITNDLRMDQAMELQSRRVWVDVVVVTAGSPANEDEEAFNLEAAAKQRKNRKYAAEAKRQDAELVTFQLTTEGGWGKEALRFARNIAAEASHTHTKDKELERLFMRRVARAIQQANGDIMRKGRRLATGPPLI
jgi:hypothetical protein